MAGTREQALKNLEKVDYSKVGRSKGSQNQSTISKENARKMYEEKLALHFEEISDIAFKEAKKDENTKERIYVTDQMIGKATETKKIELEIDMDLEL